MKRFFSFCFGFIAGVLIITLILLAIGSVFGNLKFN